MVEKLESGLIFFVGGTHEMFGYSPQSHSPKCTTQTEVKIVVYELEGKNVEKTFTGDRLLLWRIHTFCDEGGNSVFNSKCGRLYAGNRKRIVNTKARHRLQVAHACTLYPAIQLYTELWVFTHGQQRDEAFKPVLPLIKLDIWHKRGFVWFCAGSSPEDTTLKFFVQR